MIPSWIKTKVDGSFFVSFDGCKCERCKKKWYPRINEDGTLKLRICPKCKSYLWNEVKN